jgi:hypothetical protein
MAHFNLDEYQTVAERLELFWKEHASGRILTKCLEMSPSRFIVYSEIYFDAADPHPKATGLAEETVQGRGVNATSALENCESSSIGRALANCGYSPKGDAAKRPSREEMSKVAAKVVAQEAIADVKAKMSQTASTYVPVPNDDDLWTIKEAAPVQTMDGAVDLLKKEMGARTEKDIPRCPKCHDGREMKWKTGVSGKTKKPWGNFSCFTCDSVEWYEITADGSWQPQKKW